MHAAASQPAPPPPPAFDLPSQYRPAEHEERIRARWESSGAFHADPQRVLSGQAKPYCILIPPPNVTDRLHLGHALNNTLQDILARAHRMMGFETLWMPGTDHAGIATQAVVERRLRKEGKLKGPLKQAMKREEFVAAVQSFKDEYEATITDQLKRMGCSCDWARQRFTMDEICARAVREAFFRLFKDGLIYRGKRLVNWDPALQTAVADDEVEDIEVEGQFYYLRYPLMHPCRDDDDPTPVTWSELFARGYPMPPEAENPATAALYEDDKPAWLTVATTRPETYLGDVAVAVNPRDPRAASLRELCCELPLVGRRIPIVEDDYVVLPAPNMQPSMQPDREGGRGSPPNKQPDREGGRGSPPNEAEEPTDPKALFTTGFLKVTPAHDANDYDLWQRHRKEIYHGAVNVMAPDASISDKHGWEDVGDAHIFVGKSREEARKLVVREFEARGLYGGSRPHRHTVKHSDRSKAAIEPYLSDQWFVKVTDDRLAGAALRAMAEDQRSPRRQAGAGAVGASPRPPAPAGGSDQSPRRQAGAGAALASPRPPASAGGSDQSPRRQAGADAAVGSPQPPAPAGGSDQSPRRQAGADAAIGSPRPPASAGGSDQSPRRQAGGGAVGTSPQPPAPAGGSDQNPRRQAGADAALGSPRPPASAGGSDQSPRRQAGAGAALGSPRPPASAGGSDGDGSLRFYPDRYARTYQSWHDNIRDWCISRQLWWGHRIPVWSLSRVFSLLDPRHPENGLQVPYPPHIRDQESARSFKSKIDHLAAEGRLYWTFAFTRSPTDPWSLRPMGEDYYESEIFVCVHSERDVDAVAFLESNNFTQDPDVLDTWFSSALWPMSTMGWPEPPPEMGGLLEAFNPTSVLCTAREIITLWVSRMVMFNRYFMGQESGVRGQGSGPVPFRDVFIHAMIQDGEGRKMSKSLGNGVDPLDIIASHGADAMRFILCHMTTHTQDVRMPVVKDSATGRNTSPKFDLGRNFCNKAWNATRFALGILSPRREAGADAAGESPQPPASAGGSDSLLDRWMLSRLAASVADIDAAIASYSFSEYAQSLYDLLWRDFCDWYLEGIKPTVAGDPRQRAVLAHALETIIRLLHPVAPFITEALWEKVREVETDPVEGFDLAPSRLGGLLCTAGWPRVSPSLRDEAAERDFERVRTLVTRIREVRAAQQVAPKRKVTLHLPEPLRGVPAGAPGLIESLAGVERIDFGPPPASAAAFSVDGRACALSNLADAVDAGAERKRLEKAIADAAKTITTLEARLANPGYADKAPPHMVQQTRDQLAKARADHGAAVAALARLA